MEVGGWMLEVGGWRLGVGHKSPVIQMGGWPVDHEVLHMDHMARTDPYKSKTHIPYLGHLICETCLERVDGLPRDAAHLCVWEREAGSGVGARNMDLWDQKRGRGTGTGIDPNRRG